MNKRKVKSLKRKGFTVEEMSDKSVVKVCKQSVSEVMSLPIGFTVQSFHTNCELNYNLSENQLNYKNRNILLKRNGFVIRDNDMTVESNMNVSKNQKNKTRIESNVEMNVISGNYCLKSINKQNCVNNVYKQIAEIFCRKNKQTILQSSVSTLIAVKQNVFTLRNVWMTSGFKN